MIVTDYSRENTELILKALIESNININISMFYELQDTYKTIKDLTYHIGNVKSELKYSNENREDLEIAAFTYNDAKYIRKEMQINNENMYFLYTYINISANDLESLKKDIERLEGILQSKGIQTKRSVFREEEVFLSCMPLDINSNIIKEASRRNVLTSGILGTYPFFATDIFDENGVFMGQNVYDSSLIFIDRYNDLKYKNSNMCIFGTSGSGKSYYTKLLVMRSSLLRNKTIYNRSRKRSATRSCIINCI